MTGQGRQCVQKTNTILQACTQMVGVRVTTEKTECH